MILLVSQCVWGSESVLQPRVKRLEEEEAPSLKVSEWVTECVYGWVSKSVSISAWSSETESLVSEFLSDDVYH